MPGAIFIRLNFLIKHGFAEIKTIRMDSRIFFFFFRQPINRAKSFFELLRPRTIFPRRRHARYGIINRPVGSTSHGGRWNGIPTIGTANGENFKLLRKREFFATLKFTSTCDGIEAFGAENFHGGRGGEGANDT